MTKPTTHPLTPVTIDATNNPHIETNTIQVHPAWALGNNAARNNKPNNPTQNPDFTKLTKHINKTPPHHLAYIEAARQYNNGYNTYTAFKDTQ